MLLARQDQRHLRLCGFGLPYPRRHYTRSRAFSRAEFGLRLRERWWFYMRRSFLGW